MIIISTCNQKLTCVSLIYSTEPTTNSGKKTRSKKRIGLCSEVGLSVNSPGNRGVSVSPEEEKKSYDGKDLQKRKILSLK